MAKYDIFLSHTGEEAEFAKILKDWIEKAFKDCDIFLSSDIASIAAGKKWMDIIKDALNSCKLFLVVCSNISITKPWINFEVGCAWIKDTPVIPICISEFGKSDLPSHLSLFQALDFESDKFISDLFTSLLDYKFVREEKEIDQNSMKNDLTKAIMTLIEKTREEGNNNVVRSKLGNNMINTMKAVNKGINTVHNISQYNECETGETKACTGLLVDMGYFQENGEKFSLTENGEKFFKALTEGQK